MKVQWSMNISPIQIAKGGEVITGTDRCIEWKLVHT